MATQEPESTTPNDVEDTTEDTPLLSRENDEWDEDAPRQRTSRSPSASLLLRSIKFKSTKKSCLRRWPSLLALLILCIVVIIILVFAFLTPQVMKEYSAEAVEFEPSNLAIEYLNTTGVLAHVKGRFSLNASKVTSKPIRDLGKFGTWIAREVETRPTKVHVSFPEYGHETVGTAEVPPIKVNVRNGRVTALDFETFLIPGSKEAMARVVDDYLHGKLGQLRVKAEADVSFKSGLFSFPKQTLSQSLVFEADDKKTIPDYDIRHITVKEETMPDGNKGLAAQASIEIANPFPIGFAAPPLGFAVHIPKCESTEQRIMLGDAVVGEIQVKPQQNITLNVTGHVRRLPKDALVKCPDSDQSSLDLMVASYIRGDSTLVFVQGSDSPSLDTPEWLVNFTKQVIVPIEIPGRPPKNLVKDFAIDNVDFDLPSFFADPDSPESKPRVSGEIRALIDIPDEVNFPISVHRIKAVTQLYYKKDYFGYLALDEWQDAKSRPVKDENDHADLEVQSHVEKTPLNIVDYSVFGIVLKKIISGSEKLNLTAKANVTADTETALGRIVIKNIPGEGQVPVNTLGGQNFSSFAPLVHDLQIIETTPDSLHLQALVNFTNPTPYSANVPFLDVQISVNDTVVGHATATNVSITHGDNDNIPAQVFWAPGKQDPKGIAIGREFLSQYLSGENVTLTFQTHENSIPSQPDLGKALSAIKITLPMPRLGMPDNDDDDDDDDDDEDDDKSPHFIRKATMHLLSSTTTFMLQSPFKKTTMFITTLNATAFYKDDPVGHIDYEGSIEVAPGLTETPRLPVDWSLDSVGYEAVKKALGGTLKLDALADVGVRIGRWQQDIWFKGRGIGAHVTF